VKMRAACTLAARVLEFAGTLVRVRARARACLALMPARLALLPAASEPDVCQP